MKIFCVGGQKFLFQFKSENYFKCSSVLHTKFKNFNLFLFTKLNTGGTLSAKHVSQKGECWNL